MAAVLVRAACGGARQIKRRVPVDMLTSFLPALSLASCRSCAPPSPAPPAHRTGKSEGGSRLGGWDCDGNGNGPSTLAAQHTCLLPTAAAATGMCYHLHSSSCCQSCSLCRHLPCRHGMLGEYAAREGGTRIMHALKHSQLLRRKLQGRLLPACAALLPGACAGAGACRCWLWQAVSAPLGAMPSHHQQALHGIALSADYSELELTELLTQVFLEGHQGALQASQHPHRWQVGRVAFSAARAAAMQCTGHAAPHGYTAGCTQTIVSCVHMRTCLTFSTIHRPLTMLRHATASHWAAGGCSHVSIKRAQPWQQRLRCIIEQKKHLSPSPHLPLPALPALLNHAPQAGAAVLPAIHQGQRRQVLHQPLHRHAPAGVWHLRHPGACAGKHPLGSCSRGGLDVVSLSGWCSSSCYRQQACHP